MTSSHYDFGARLFQALSSPVRLRILELLSASGRMTVGEMQQRLGIAPANASQHLAVLRDRGLVQRTRDATRVWYAMTDPRLRNVLDDARALFEHRLGDGGTVPQTVEPDSHAPGHPQPR